MPKLERSDIHADHKYRLKGGKIVIVLSRVYSTLDGMPVMDAVRVQECSRIGHRVPSRPSVDLTHGQFLDLVAAPF